MEEWRPVIGWPRYEVSSLGRVRRDSKILKQDPSRGGYLSVRLYRKGENKNLLVHRLVCEAWNGPQPSPDHEVAHGGPDRHKNEPGYLRWATRLENTHDRHDHGTMARGSVIAQSKLTEGQIPAIRSLIAAGMTDTDIASRFGCGRTNIALIRTNKTWRHI